jgi:hypothetical protein
MGTNFNPTTIQSGFRDTDLLNALFSEIETELGNMLNRTGVAPNAMAADLDMGSNQLLNVAEGTNGTDGVNLNQVTNVATSIATTILSGAGGGGGGTTADPITFNYYVAAGSEGTMTRTVFDLGTLAGVTSFTGLTVAVNGVIQVPGQAYTVDGVEVTFTESLETDSSVFFIYGDLTPTPVFNSVNATLSETTATATVGQTVFTAPTYIIGKGQLMVHIDGVMQSLGFGDYTETTTTSITLDTAMSGGERITIRNISGTT